MSEESLRGIGMQPGEILPGITSSNPKMHLLAAKLQKIVHSGNPIFLFGPTGCGKEVFAKAIHQLSGCSGEFIAINCGAVPDALFESLFFGHERGSFTGADRCQEGLFTLANGGVLFLDEIAELPLLQQAKLLRVLETNRYRRVGAQQEFGFTGRIVTATHADLPGLIKLKQFREDLYYRINAFQLTIPSLSDRRDDIPHLIKYFMQNARVTFSDCAIAYLQRASWPGNIRQLKTTVDRICVFADDPLITAKVIEEMQECEFPGDPLKEVAGIVIDYAKGDKIQMITDALVNEALLKTKGNKSKAAEILGVHRKVIERRSNAITG